jgi:hypothetical protein
MGYRDAAHSGEAVIEVYPIKGKALTEAAEGAGLSPSAIPALLLEGAKRARLARRVTHALGRRFSAVLGFESDADAARAVPLIRKAAR